MKRASYLVVVRHGETQSNVNDRVSGYDDNPALTKNGRRQASQKRSLLSGATQHIWSGSRERHIDTGRLVFGTGLQTTVIEQLNERKYGSYDSGPNSAWKAYMESLKPAMEDLSPHQVRNFDFGPGIENEQQVEDRMMQVIAKIGDVARGRVGGVVGSGGTLKGILEGCGYTVPTGAIDNVAHLVVRASLDDIHVENMSGVHLDA